MKSVRIRSYSGPSFPAFRRNTERYFYAVQDRATVKKILRLTILVMQP